MPEMSAGWRSPFRWNNSTASRGRPAGIPLQDADRYDPLMTARQEILEKVRQRLPKGPVPEAPPERWTVYPQPNCQFAAVLTAVGGRCVEAADADAANADLLALPAYISAVKRVSCVPGVGTSNLDLAAIADPHALAEVEFAVLPGELAVAENGAVWVSTDSVLERTLFFLSQHLALVVPAGHVVSNLHEAYRRLDVARRRFGAFISGPSKTADIEQSLVIGAHGARSLTVYLLGPPPA